MKAKKNPLERLKKKYNNRLDKLISHDASYVDLLNAIRNSPQNEFGGLIRHEIKNFESSFIKEIEKCLPSLEKIAKNPRQFIKDEYNVVPVERVKKIGSKAVQHLAMHSEFIKEIDADGNVVPEKILGTFVEEDLAIYENRFIMTLIRKLVLFVELRYRYIAAHADTTNSDLFTIKSIVKFGDLRYEYEGRLKLVLPSDDGGNRLANDDLLRRLTVLHQRVNYLLDSSFMKALKKATIVTGKIQLTNILRRNPDYKKGYELWTFISKYRALGVSFSVKEKKVVFDDVFQSQLFKLVLSSYLSLNSEKLRPADKAVKKLKIVPHFVTPILDSDVSSDRFLEKALHKSVSLRSLTDAQIKAKENRERAKEKAKARKLVEEQVKKEKMLAQKEREKEAEIKRALKKKENERNQKLAAIAKKKAKADHENQLRLEEKMKQKEKEAAARRLAEEALRLQAARTQVKIIATTHKTKLPIRIKKEIKNSND